MSENNGHVFDEAGVDVVPGPHMIGIPYLIFKGRKIKAPKEYSMHQSWSYLQGFTDGVRMERDDA